MRYLVLSDIHGGASELRKALCYKDVYNCDLIVLLGDLLNHGPRNIVPDTYNPREVAGILNEYKDKIISVRGNCDSEVDSMMFDFPCNAPYGYIYVDCKSHLKKIFLTHGHLYDIKDSKVKEKLGLNSSDIVLSGHTHISGVFRLDNGLININVGSTTLPKGDCVNSFGVIFEDRICVYTLDNALITEYSFCG